MCLDKFLHIILSYSDYQCIFLSSHCLIFVVDIFCDSFIWLGYSIIITFSESPKPYYRDRNDFKNNKQFSNWHGRRSRSVSVIIAAPTHHPLQVVLRVTCFISFCIEFWTMRICRYIIAGRFVIEAWKLKILYFYPGKGKVFSALYFESFFFKPP